MAGKTLFLFTKQFPFGHFEKYVSDELPFLAEAFGEVVLVPCEYFGDEKAPDYKLPVNVSVLLINKLPGLVHEKPAKRWGELLQTWFSEFAGHPFRHYLLRYFKRYLSILFYQQACADVFSKHLQDKKYDLTQTVFYTYWLHNSALMLALMRKRGTIDGFVSRAHSIDLYSEWWPVASRKQTPLPFILFKIRWISKVVTISKHGYDHLVRRFPGYTDKFAFSRLGVADPGTLNPPGDGGDFVIVTCSHLTPNKRIGRMPGILSGLGFPVKWIHFGGRGEDLEQLRRQTESLPASVRVELRGQVKNEEINRFYKENTVHLFMNLSRVEGLPVSIMEAQSHGIPVMATAVYGTPEIVNEENGHLIPAEFSDEEAAGFIRQLKENPARMEKLRKNARKHFETYFHAPENFKTFIRNFLHP